MRQFKLGIYTLLPLLLACGCVSAQSTSNSKDAIPDSVIATATGNGVVRAMLSCATSRYAHGVLGDAIEAGCLVLEDEEGASHVLELPETQVFEDLLPRIADINHDGINDVVVVRSDSKAGAALAIYTISNNEVKELAVTPAIGTAYRWLAPVGIADFNDDSRLDIAYVQTPHIGGILKIWSMSENELELISETRGFSNHSIGSKRVSTAKLIDHNNDGVVDIALPDQGRQHTVWITLSPELAVIDKQPYDLSYFD